MKKYEVTIAGRTWSFKMDSIFGPMYLYEVIAGKDMPFDPSRLLCLHLLFWCILSKANDGFAEAVSFEEFVRSLSPATSAALTEMYGEQAEALSRDADNEPSGSDDKKKT